MQNTAGHVADEACPRNHSRHVYHAGDLHAVLYRDRLFHDLQRRRAGRAWLRTMKYGCPILMAVIGFGVMVPVADACWRTHLAVGKAWSSLPRSSFSSLFAFTRCLGSRQSSAGIRAVPVDLGLMGLTFLAQWGAAARVYFRRGSALYRRIVFLQCVINSGRFRRAIYCHMAAKPLRAGGGEGFYTRRQWRR